MNQLGPSEAFKNLFHLDDLQDALAHLSELTLAYWWVPMLGLIVLVAMLRLINPNFLRQPAEVPRCPLCDSRLPQHHALFSLKEEV